MNLIIGNGILPWKEITIAYKRAAIEQLETLVFKELKIPLHHCELSWAAEHLIHQAWNNVQGYQKRMMRKRAMKSPSPNIITDDEIPSYEYINIVLILLIFRKKSIS